MLNDLLIIGLVLIQFSRSTICYLHNNNAMVWTVTDQDVQHCPAELPPARHHRPVRESEAELHPAGPAGEPGGAGQAGHGQPRSVSISGCVFCTE